MLFSLTKLLVANNQLDIELVVSFKSLVKVTKSFNIICTVLINLAVGKANGLAEICLPTVM
ncbi:hypothetical protein II941_04040 [bacterium]|nr:hypothetical protein [bacterium]